MKKKKKLLRTILFATCIMTLTLSCGIYAYAKNSTGSVKVTLDVSNLYEKSRVVEPTCTEKGYTVYVLKENPIEDAYTDDYVDALGHLWGEWTVTKEATATEEGLEQRKCTRCNDIQIRTIDKLTSVTIAGHVYDSQGNPVGNALIELHSKVQTTATDKDGYYSFSNVELGDHSLTVIQDGTKLCVMKFALDNSAGKITATSTSGEVDVLVSDATIDVIQIALPTEESIENPVVDKIVDVVTSPQTGEISYVRVVALAMGIGTAVTIASFGAASIFGRKRKKLKRTRSRR